MALSELIPKDFLALVTLAMSLLSSSKLSTDKTLNGGTDAARNLHGGVANETPIQEKKFTSRDDLYKVDIVPT